MRELLLAIQNALQESSTLNYIKDSNIYIVELDNMIPSSSKFPLIIIKDYGENSDQQISHRFYKKSRIQIKIFNRLYEVGDSAKNKGILEIEEDVLDILLGNSLSICEIYSAFPIIQERTTSINLTEKDTISYKTLIMEYESYRKW